VALVSALKIKEVKPAKLKEAEMRRCFRNAMRRVGTGMRKDFERTVATWEHKPEFRESTHVTKNDDEIAVEVWTENKIYGYVNDGTRPHDIWAGAYTGKSNKKVLAFVPGGVPKTQPGRLDAGPGSPGTGAAVYTPHVRHPGTEGRHYDRQIEREWDKKFKHEVEIAMRQAQHVSGHAR
jgi:hypothetical protein